MPLPRSALVCSLALLVAGGCARRDDTSRRSEGAAPAETASAAERGVGGAARPDETNRGGKAAESELPERAEAGSQGKPTESAPGTSPGLGAKPSAGPREAAAIEGERLERAARRALEEAALVAPGRDDCETAYARLTAVIGSMARAAPDRVGQLPEQGQFLGLCARLPPAMQRCLVIEHAIEHEEECAREHEALDPGLRASLEALMSGNG